MSPNTTIDSIETLSFPLTLTLLTTSETEFDVKNKTEKNVIKKNFIKFFILPYLTQIELVFNLAQLSAVFMSFIVAGILLAYFLKSLSLKILFIVLTISRKPILLLKNRSTNTSFAALIMVGVNNPYFKLFSIKLTEGN